MRSTAPNLVSIVLPVHNQADHIEAVVTGYQAALSHVGCQHELILVSNACRDESPAICRELARSVDTFAPSIRRQAAGAWRSSWACARRRDVARIHQLGADQTGSIGDARLAGAPEPRGRRQGPRQGRTGLRKLGSSLYNWESRLLFQSPCSDVNGTPKFFPRRFDKLLCDCRVTMI